MTYMINLVLAVLCTLLLLLHCTYFCISIRIVHHQDEDEDEDEEDECSFAGGPFMGVTESRGGANTWLKQRDFASIRSFILPGFPF